MPYTREEWKELNALQRGPCIEWQKYRDPRGYGRKRSQGKSVLVHRVAWMEQIGDIPLGTPCVLHHCDNPPCYNVHHLWLGTREENNIDRDLKGRGGAAFGDANGSRLHPEKLAWGDRNPKRLMSKNTSNIDAIRAEYATGAVTQAQLSDKYGMCRSNISHIVNGKTWN